MVFFFSCFCIFSELSVKKIMYNNVFAIFKKIFDVSDFKDTEVVFRCDLPNGCKCGEISSVLRQSTV